MASWKRNELGVFFFCFRQEHRTEDKQAMAIQSHFLEPLVGASLLAIFSSKYSLRERDMTAQTSTLTIWAKAKNMKRKEHQQFFRRFLPSKVSMGLTRRNQLDQTRSKSKSTKLYPPPPSLGYRLPGIRSVSNNCVHLLPADRRCRRTRRSRRRRRSRRG